MQSIYDQMQKDTRDMMKAIGPEPAVTMADLVALLKSMGAGVGADDVVRTAGYGVAGVSGHAAAGATALAGVNNLALIPKPWKS